jgi:alanine racemase
VAESARGVETGGSAAPAGGRVTIDLGAIAENYRVLSRLSAPAKTAAVVKADAYGLGIAQVVPALVLAGCETFFVAMPAEALAVREAAPVARVYVLNPLLDRDAARSFHQARLRPVLNTMRDVALWGGVSGRDHRYALNVDTGMNRLGVTPGEAIGLADITGFEGPLPALVMSHLACADEPDHPKNREQLESFQRVRAAFAGIESSLANSAGVLLGSDYHFDLTRPGIALYAGGRFGTGRTEMRQAVTLELRVAQIRHAKSGEMVSYGATERLKRDTVIAVVSAGYADGILRSASGTGVPLREAVPQGGAGFVGGRRVPILGRVTMDLTMFDVTDLGPDAVKTGDWIELYGPNISLDEAAKAAGTISYELLTGLGTRFERRYVGAAK